MNQWVILIPISLFITGSYYCLNLPAATSLALPEWLHLTESAFTYQLYLLYAVYAFPGIVMPLVSGLLIDRFGAHYLAIVFSLMYMIGQVIYSLGVSFRNLTLMLAGRLLTGLIGESIDTLNSVFITTWIDPTMHGKAFGINAAYEKVVQAVSDLISPRLADSNVQVATWVSLVACFISLIAAIVYFILHSKNRKPEETVIDLGTFEEKRPEKQEHSFKTILNDLKSLKPIFWLLFLMHFIYYATFDPYTVEFLQEKYYPEDTNMIGLVLSLPSMISIGALPLSGLVLDLLSRKSGLWMLPFGLLLEAIARCLIYFTSINPVVLFAIRGIAQSIVLCLVYSQVPLIVQQRLQGSAFGFITISQTFSQVCFPFFSARILDKYHSYDQVQLYLACCVLMSLLLSFIYVYVQHKHLS
ncbi:major facilitator superfamily domain-containing protein [Gorgonomyces haynaldii]|nr:major facilitator superfamily domain-containing protein [Gorgonomyces haynaldii]